MQKVAFLTGRHCPFTQLCLHTSYLTVKAQARWKTESVKERNSES